jgi:tRNA pseudouridine38-40 synthase
MNEAAGMIMNYTDFTCFAKTGAQTTTNNCTVLKSVWEVKDNFLIYKTEANRYLRNMVRAMVGTLIDVGKEKLNLDQFNTILQTGTRSDAGQSVPACGLFLEDISYPENIRIL